VNLEDWANGVLGGTPLDADRLNYRDDLLDKAIVQLARNPEALFGGAVQYDANGAPTSAVVEWPDGSTGTYAGTPSVSSPGAISAYTITRIVNGATITYTQPAITRDSATGNVTNRPPITIS